MQQNYNKGNSQMNKFTKTIMSPLTTMPAVQKMIVITSNNNIPNREKITPNKINNQTNDRLSSSPQSLAINNVQVPNQNSASSKFDPQFSQNVKSFGKATETFEKPKSVEHMKNGNTSVKSGKILLGALHPYICCSLCSGYLIKATTIVECCHTFCHSCLMKYLTGEKQCPQCGMNIIKSKTNIK